MTPSGTRLATSASVWCSVMSASGGAIQSPAGEFEQPLLYCLTQLHAIKPAGRQVAGAKQCRALESGAQTILSERRHTNPRQLLLLS
jgi:hypothetical protein